MQTLTDLGWTPQRSAALPTDAVVGRVSRVDRGIASVLTPAGAMRVRVPNRLLSTQDTDQIPTVGTGCSCTTRRSTGFWTVRAR